MILNWTALRPSARERRWRRGALGAAFGVVGLLLWATIAGDPRHPELLWTALALAVVMFAVATRRADQDVAREICIGRDGVILLRDATIPGGPVVSLGCVFRAPWLITLVHGTMWMPVWPDTLPADEFRRLWVCVRWGRSKGKASAAIDGAGDSGRNRP